MSTIPIATRRWMRFSCIIAFAVVTLIGAAIALCYSTSLSYVYCLIREDSWLSAQTEADLDGRMWAFYRKRSIAPSDSMWGRNYVLQPDERIVQYLVFAKEPLDVVLDDKSRIVAAFTSYE